MYVGVFRIHCPGAISCQRDWDQVSDGARAPARAPSATGRLHVCGFQRKISRSLLGKYFKPRASASGRWRSLRCQGKLTGRGPDRLRELQVSKEEINSESSRPGDNWEADHKGPADQCENADLSPLFRPLARVAGSTLLARRHAALLERMTSLAERCNWSMSELVRKLFLEQGYQSLVPFYFL